MMIRALARAPKALPGAAGGAMVRAVSTQSAGFGAGGAQGGGDRRWAWGTLAFAAAAAIGGAAASEAAPPSVSHSTTPQMTPGESASMARRVREQAKAAVAKNKADAAAAADDKARRASADDGHAEPASGAKAPRAGSIADKVDQSQRARRRERNLREGRHAMLVFTGNGNVDLAKEIGKNLGVKMGNITVSRFADGEVNVMVHENVRGKDVYIIQPTCPPVNEHLMELLLMVSTMRRSSARKITAVIPYYGYARQDRKMTARVPISAADVARLLESMGVDRVVAVDLHCGQIQGFFGPRVPVDNLDAGPVGVDYFGEMELVNPVVVSPDAGGVYRAKKFRDGLNSTYQVDADLAMIIKQRRGAGQIERMDLVGSVEDSDVVIVDDMIDTAGTLCTAANELKMHGARRVFAFASHGLFSGPASGRIQKSALEEVVVVNTVPLRGPAMTNTKIRQLSVAPLLAEAIRRVHNKQSVSDLFRGKQGSDK